MNIYEVTAKGPDGDIHRYTFEGELPSIARLCFKGSIKRAGKDPFLYQILRIQQVPVHRDYDCEVCRSFADNFVPRSYPTPEEPWHPDCYIHQGVK